MVEVLLPVGGPRSFPYQEMTPRSCRNSALRVATLRRRAAPLIVQNPEGVLEQVVEAAERRVRQQRQQEMEKELYEKLGLSEVPGQTATPQARPRSAGPGGHQGAPGAPPRPPKPKPHRSIAPQVAAPPQSVEELPAVRRWKSAFMPLWLDAAPEKSPETPPCDLSQTAPAAMSMEHADPSAADQDPLSPVQSGAWPAVVGPTEAKAASSLVAPTRDIPPVPSDPSHSAAAEGAPSCYETRQGAKLLEENTRRLREKLQHLRLENRRHRVGPTGDGREVVDEGETTAPLSQESQKRFEEMRRKIAVLEESTDAERERLKLEQQEAEERRRSQEAFERSLQERIERDLREHREREAREAAEQSAKEDEARQALEERSQRRREQLLQEAARSRQLEEQRLGAVQSSPVEEELENQRAEHEAEERRRIFDYARDRRKQFEDWERCLAAERQRFASEAEFCAAARRQKARLAAQADEEFYAPQREVSGQPPPSTSPPSGSPVRGNRLNTEERALLKELHAVQMAPRDVQKAKVKDLLLRWHPDKNPSCPDKAKHLFQFVQQQRQVVLGL